MTRVDHLDLPDDLADWLVARAPRSQGGTISAAAVDAIAMAKSIDEAGKHQRERAIALTADDLRALADS
jgi:hypothetical protein